MNWLSLILLPALVQICITDIRTFRVNLFLLLAAIGISIARIFSNASFQLVITQLVLNFVFLGILVAIILIATLFLKKKLNNSFGWGDMLFLMLAAFNFSPLNFVVFIMVSAFVSILLYRFRIHNINNKLQPDKIAEPVYHHPANKHQQPAIPFAGYMAAILFVLILIDIFTPFSCYNDYQLLSLLNQQ